MVRAGCHPNGSPAILLIAHVGPCQGQARRTVMDPTTVSCPKLACPARGCLHMICGAKFPAPRASPLSKGANGDVTSGDTCRLYSCHVCRIKLHMLGYVVRLSHSCTPNEAVTLRLHRPVKMFSTARLDGKLRSWGSVGSAHGLISGSPSLLALHHGKTGKVAVLEAWKHGVPCVRSITAHAKRQLSIGPRKWTL
jgi:hypothetical protein